jgi:hypothetical protein
MSLDHTMGLVRRAPASAILPTDAHPRAIFTLSTLMNRAVNATFKSAE